MQQAEHADQWIIKRQLEEKVWPIFFSVEHFVSKGVLERFVNSGHRKPQLS